MKLKTYSELIRFSSFDDRFHYLQLHGSVGRSTFGFDRYINQRFYESSEWKRIRDFVILRDMGCDLGCKDDPISGKIYIHHMNPITSDDMNNPDKILNPEYLISVSLETHNAIHYGDDSILDKNKILERFANDTSIWKKEK